MRKPKHRPLISLLLVFCLVAYPAKAVIITEIGAFASEGAEWVEIYNNTDTAVNLENFIFFEQNTNHQLNFPNSSVLAPQSYALIVEDVEGFLGAFPGEYSLLIDSSWGSLNESGEYLALKNSAGEIVDDFTYPAAPDFSLERTALERGASWREHPNGHTAGQANLALTEQNSAEPPQNSENNPNEPVGETSTEQNLPWQGRLSEIHPNPESGAEWIELETHNFGQGLVGYTIEDNTGQILVLNLTTYTKYPVFELNSSRLNNDGDVVILKNPAGEVVDSITYGSEEISSPPRGQSISRINGAVIISPATRGAINNTSNTNQSTSSDNQQSTQTTNRPSELPYFAPGSLIVSELVSDPTDGEREFVEIFNPNSFVIDLAGWQIEDGSETVTKLSGTLNSQSYLVIFEPKGQLNNAGDRVALISPRGDLIDEMFYGNWPADKTLVSPAAKDPFSLIRNSRDEPPLFVVGNPTPGAANQPAEESEVGEEKNFPLKISEVYANPPGDDSKDEFIEIQNTGSTSGVWKNLFLSDLSGQKYKITELNLSAGEAKAFFRQETKIALNNTGTEDVSLRTEKGTVIDKISFSGAKEGESLHRLNGENFLGEPSPNRASVTQNKKPIAIIEGPDKIFLGGGALFDGSDSSDPENSPLNFVWSVNQRSLGQETILPYLADQVGKFTLRLTINDGQHESFIEKIFTVISTETGTGLSSSDFKEIPVLNEWLANPDGPDTEEFIELYNPSDNPIDLSGWKLDDVEGGSRPYVFEEDTLILPKGFLVIPKEKSRLSLNNTTDSVRLIDKEGVVVIDEAYDEVEEGLSHSRMTNGFYAFAEPSPGAVNRSATTRTQKSSSAGKAKVAGFAPRSIVEKENFEVGDRIMVSGVVTLEPGAAGKQIVYIADEATGEGIQIYEYRGDFPTGLKTGDRIEVKGTISVAYGELRLKSKPADMKKLTGETPAITPKLKEISGLSESDLGGLIEVHGEIVERKSGYIFLDDGSGEIKISLRKEWGMGADDLPLEHSLRVYGVLTEQNDSWRLLPAGAEAFDLGENNEPTIDKKSDTENMATPVSRPNNLSSFFSGAAGAAVSLALGLLARARGAALSVFGKKLLTLLKNQLFKNRV